jgi:putative FmdB family regulatory protein
MPTYEYRCPQGHGFELFQRMSDEPRAACPTCGEDATRILSGGAGFLFKGDGFYITDYRSESYRSQAKKESGDGGSGSSPSPSASSSPPSSAPSSTPSSSSSNAS